MSTTRAQMPRLARPRALGGLSALSASRVPVLVVFGLACAALVALSARWGLRWHVYQPDEVLNVIGARHFQDDPVGFLTDHYFFTRGPERLTAMVLALVNAVVPGTAASEMQAGHIVLAACLVATAPIAYALARGLGAGRWPAAGAGLLTVAGPWLVLGTSFMNTTLAAPLTALLALVAWWAVVRPAWWRDVLVLGVAVTAIYARTSTFPLLAAVALTVLVASWRATPRWRSPPAFARTLVRRHAVLVAVGLVGVVWFVTVGPSAVIGEHYQSTLRESVTLHTLWNYVATLFAELGMGTGWLPIAVGLPWVVREAVRPRSPESGAFGVLALGLFAAFTYTMAHANAVPEERYIAVLAFLPPVAFAAALARRQVSIAGALVAAVLLARAAAVSRGVVDPGPYGYFAAPVRRFFVDVICGRVSIYFSGSAGDLVTPVLIGFVVLVAVFLLAYRRRPAVAAGVAVAALVVFGAAQGEWASRRLITTAGAPGDRWSQLAWIDHATHDGRAAYLSDDYGHNETMRLLMLRANYFNSSIRNFVGPQTPIEDSGLMPGNDVPYFVSFAGYRSIILAGHRVAQSLALGPPIPIRVEKLDRPTRALVRVLTTQPGAVVHGTPVQVQVFRGARDRCLSLPLLATDPRRGRTRVRLTTDRVRRDVVLPRVKYRTTVVPLRGTKALWINVRTPKSPVAIGEVRVVGCP